MTRYGKSLRGPADRGVFASMNHSALQMSQNFRRTVWVFIHDSTARRIDPVWLALVERRRMRNA